MNIASIRKELKTNSVYNIKLRVVDYSRVSTERIEQLNSLSNQIDHFGNFIKQNAEWQFVKSYVDEGISGISTCNRDSFMQMIEDAKNEEFDLIITKEISRFARNTLDSIKYTRELLACGVGVLFYNDNICTFDEDAELRLTIMASIAQDEIRKLSSRVKFGSHESMKKGVVFGNSRIYGYRKENKRLVIDEDQAPCVRRLFELYSTDKYSLKQLETVLFNEGLTNSKGAKISHVTLSNIIRNPKYKGYYCGNKVEIEDMFTKKQRFKGEEEWICYKDETGNVVPAIVSEELWDNANAILQRRSNDVKNRSGISNHPNIVTGKMFCAICGKPYYRKSVTRPTGRVDSSWYCSGRMKYGKEYCYSYGIYESEVTRILLDIFNEISSDSIISECENEFIEIIKRKKESASDKAKIADKISAANDKLAKAFNMNVEGKLSDEAFECISKKFDTDIKRLKDELSEISKLEKSNVDIDARIADIKRGIKKAKDDASNGIIDCAFVNTYVDKIIVKPVKDDRNTLNIEVTLTTGDVYSGTTTRGKKCCMGNMGLKILPIRNFQIGTLRKVKGSKYDKTENVKINVSVFI